MYKILCQFFIILLPWFSLGQSVVIGEIDTTAHESAILDIHSNNKGILLPQIDTSQISNPTEGLLIYDRLVKSFWYSNATAWTKWDIENRWQLSGLNLYNKYTGNVGIGVSRPTNKLDIYTAFSDDGIRINGVGPKLSLGPAFSGIGFATDTTQFFSTASQGDLVLLTENNVHFNIGTTGQNVMIIDGASGNIGIGNPNPVARLSLKGGAAEQLRVRDFFDTNRQFIFGLSSISGARCTSIRQGTGGTTTFFNPEGGKIGIGTTNPVAALHIKAESETIPGIKIENGGFSMGATGTFEIDDLTMPGGRLMVTEEGHVGIGRLPTTNMLEVNGEASKSSPGEWLGNSDKRLKKNISPLHAEEMLSKLLQLRGIQYEWDDQQTGLKRPKGIQYGFTAQNIQKIFPEFVTEDAKGFLQTAYGTYDAMYVECFRAMNDRIESLKQSTEDVQQELNTLSEIEKILSEQEEKLSALEQLLIEKNQQ